MNKTITLLIVGVIFLALLLMVLNAFNPEEQGHPALPVATEKTRPQHEALPSRAGEGAPAPSGILRSAPAPEEQAASRPAAAPPEPDALPSSTEGIAVKTVPAQIDPGRTEELEAPQGSVAAPPSDAPATPRASATPETTPKRAAGPKNITNIVVFATQEGATLRLAGDHPLLYKSMLLSNPDRLVLDLEGQWNINAPAVPQNKVVKAVRVGRHADFTRLAIELQRAPASSRLIKTSPQGLDIRIR